MNTLARPPLVARIRGWFTVHHLAQLALIIQPLIVFRTAGEYFRLKGNGDPALPVLIDPLFLSFSAIGAAMIVSLLLYFNRREGAVLVLTLAGIAALVVYKLVAMPGLA